MPQTIRGHQLLPLTRRLLGSRTLTPSGHVLVEDFPAHRCSRTSDWGWRVANRNVAFLSEGGDPGDTVPLPPDADDRRE